MLRKLLIAAVGAGALSLAATVPGPAQAGTLQLGSALNSISVESNIIEARHNRRRSARRHHRRDRHYGYHYGPFWAAPWAAVAPHPCYRWSRHRRGWVWRC